LFFHIFSHLLQPNKLLNRLVFLYLRLLVKGIMKFIGLYTFLCCIVACQSGNNIAPISKFKDVGDDIVSSNLENPKKDISKKDAAESSNKFFEYIPNCYYNASVNGIVNGKAANYISIINPGLFNKPTEEQLLLSITT